MSFASSFGPTPGKPKDFDGLEAFDKTEAAGDYVPVPGGNYLVRVVSGVLGQTLKGDDCYKIVFELVDGENRGRRLTRMWTITPRSVQYVKKDLTAFGLTSKKDLLAPFPPAGVEIHLQVRVVITRMDSGTEFNDIKKVWDVVRTVVAVLPPSESSEFKRFGVETQPTEGGSNVASD